MNIPLTGTEEFHKLAKELVIQMGGKYTLAQVRQYLARLSDKQHNPRRGSSHRIKPSFYTTATPPAKAAKGRPANEAGSWNPTGKHFAK